MSSSSPPNDLETESTPDVPSTAPISRESRLIVGLALALVLLPLGYYSGRREIAKWFQAASNTHLYTSNYEDALRMNQKALQWNAQSYDAWQGRVSIHLARRDTEAAVIASERRLKMARAAHDRRNSPYHRELLAYALNGCAYSIAVDNAVNRNNGGSPLEEKALQRALEMVNESLEIVIESPVFIDTRGYLHYLLGNNEKAIEDTENAVSLMKRTYKKQLEHIREESRGFVNRTRFEFLQSRVQESMAVLHYHRGLAYESAGQQKAADRDFQRAKQLGHDPANGIL